MVNFIDKLLKSKKKKTSLEVDTLPLRDLGETPVDEINQRLTSSIMMDGKDEEEKQKLSQKSTQLMAGFAQSTGIRRGQNEDTLFCLTSMITGNGGATPFGIYIVADGMGGHQQGEVASEVAARTMASHIVKEVYSNLIAPHPQPNDQTLQEIMRTGINKAHEKIVEAIRSGGTTLTATTILNKQMTIAHVGDSRIYHIGSNGCMKSLTRDHTLVKRLVELGQLTVEEAAVDPRRNILYNALGRGTPLEPEIISSPLPPSGYLLVCSDGLWGVVSENKIIDIIKKTESIPTACQKMVEAANEAGGPDNISVILIRLPD